ncbi:hypothetical protein DC429_14135 [Arthrobacter sp. TPD3018]|nr:hypothetical protein DC425_13035 [Sphingomonas sp. TPD3009]PVE54830.1 hypothetical protein DC429_14135 [Arthrobacter sp. TPD3018]PVE82588.1 hypothetical protein DC431_11660 [Sphingomonas melonis]
MFLTTMTDFAAMNEVYAEVFAERRSSRSTVAVAALPMGAEVESAVLAGALVSRLETAIETTRASSESIDFGNLVRSRT